jgi:hypothetical protein
MAGVRLQLGEGLKLDYLAVRDHILHIQIGRERMHRTALHLYALDWDAIASDIVIWTIIDNDIDMLSFYPENLTHSICLRCGIADAAADSAVSLTLLMPLPRGE